MVGGWDSAQNWAERRMQIKGIHVEDKVIERWKWTGRKRINCTRVEKMEVKQGFGSGAHSLNAWKVHSHLQSEEGNELEDGTFY